MINRILMELYDDFEQNNMDSVIEFARITFPQDGTDKLFIGSLLILFSRVGAFKSRYYVTREALYDIVLAAKEKVGKTNLLAIYVEKINTTKNISKYLKDITKSENLDMAADIILDYLDGFKPSFITEIKQNTILEKYKDMN